MVVFLNDHALNGIALCIVLTTPFKILYLRQVFAGCTVKQVGDQHDIWDNIQSLISQINLLVVTDHM